MQLDLLAPANPLPDPPVLSVTELTRRVRKLLETSIGTPWVEGEISNLRRQASGHSYFTLKDSGAQVACVLFAGQAASLRRIQLTDGMQVQIHGELSVYEARGQYQLIVRNIKLRGEGELQARFELLKRKLAEEGLFEAARKRPLPKFPRRIGLITSPTGAALRDFLHVLHRRQPGLQVIIHPVRVQGRGAAAEIAKALEDFAKPGFPDGRPVDILVLTRGGGSIEDLWEFNEESVARAIARSPIPVISAIGHEIDFTISDFAADVRAPTPSAAAEILAADHQDILSVLREITARMSRCMRSHLESITTRLIALERTALFRDPLRLLAEARQRTDRALDDMESATRSQIDRHAAHLSRLRALLSTQSPATRTAQATARLNLILSQMAHQTRNMASERQSKLTRLASLLSTLNPEAALARGYTITMEEGGRILTSRKEVDAGATLRTRFADGEVQSIASRR